MLAGSIIIVSTPHRWHLIFIEGPLYTSGDARSGMRATSGSKRRLFSLIATSLLALSCLPNAQNLILSSPRAIPGISFVDT